MRRIGLLLALALAACGVAYAPGDFLGRDTATADAGALPDATPVAEASVPEGAAPAPPTRVVLFGATRGPLPGETGLTPLPLTILTTLASDGALGGWTFDEPPPIGGTWTRAIVEDGKVYLQGATLFSEATFTDRLTSAWTAAVLPKGPGSDQGHGWLVDGRALHETSAFADTQYVAPILDDAGIGSWTAGPAETVHRVDETIVRLGSFVYAIGGLTEGATPKEAAGAAPDVEVAPYDPATGAIGAFTALDPLSAGDAGSIGDAGAPYGAYLPVVAAGAGRVVVAGGVADKSGATPSDVVLAARVTDPATGALEPWVTLPRLAQPMKDFALVVTPTMIVVFGGLDAAGAVRAEVWGLAIAGDGTYASSWTQIGALPGARSGLTAVTF